MFIFGGLEWIVVFVFFIDIRLWDYGEDMNLSEDD